MDDQPTYDELSIAAEVCEAEAARTGDGDCWRAAQILRRMADNALYADIEATKARLRAFIDHPA